MALRAERIAQRLTELRESHDLTQEQAAHKVGVTSRQWQRWEAGQSTPYPRNLDTIASRFNVSTGEFFDSMRDDVQPTQLDRIELALAGIAAKLDALQADQDDLRTTLASDALRRVAKRADAANPEPAADRPAARRRGKGSAGSRPEG